LEWHWGEEWNGREKAGTRKEGRIAEGEEEVRAFWRQRRLAVGNILVVMGK